MGVSVGSGSSCDAVYRQGPGSVKGFLFVAARPSFLAVTGALAFEARRHGFSGPSDDGGVTVRGGSAARSAKRCISVGGGEVL